MKGVSKLYSCKQVHHTFTRFCMGWEIYTSCTLFHFIVWMHAAAHCAGCTVVWLSPPTFCYPAHQRSLIVVWTCHQEFPQWSTLLMLNRTFHPMFTSWIQSSSLSFLILPVHLFILNLFLQFCCTIVIHICITLHCWVAACSVIMVYTNCTFSCLLVIINSERVYTVECKLVQC